MRESVILEGAASQNAHAGSRARVTSMGGLYDTATLRAPLILILGFPVSEIKMGMLGAGGGGEHTETNAFRVEVNFCRRTFLGETCGRFDALPQASYLSVKS